MVRKNLIQEYIPPKGLGDVTHFSTIFSTRGINYTSHRLCDDFNYAVSRFQHDGYEIISLEDNAKLRIQEGKNDTVSTYGNWTREAFLYFPKEKKRKLVKNSPLLELAAATEATQAHIGNKEYYLTEEQIEWALTDSIDIPEKSIEIPTNRFDSEEIFVWCFGGEKEAKAYGEFLRRAPKPKIKKMPITITLVDECYRKNYMDEHERPFIRQMRFGDIYNRSELDGPWGLDNGWYGLRGIKETG